MMHDELYQTNHVMKSPSSVLVPVGRHAEPKPVVLSPLADNRTACVNIKTKHFTYAQLKQQKFPHFPHVLLFFTSKHFFTFKLFFTFSFSSHILTAKLPVKYSILATPIFC